jgi:hypothetical protein
MAGGSYNNACDNLSQVVQAVDCMVHVATTTICCTCPIVVLLHCRT